MHIKHFYHLTMLVDDLDEAVAFYDRIFSPHCFMRGYAPLPLHREGALLAISDTVIEPMKPLAPETGQLGTSIYRFLDRFGPRAHSLALLVSGHEEIAARLEAASVRWTDGGLPNHVFPHPKDFPGLLELADFGDNLERFSLADPRMRPQYDHAYWQDSQGLGITRTSHYILGVFNHLEARRKWVELLDAKVLPEQASSLDSACSSYVALSDGSIVELAEPIDSTCVLADDVATVGETWGGISFQVADTERAVNHLERHRAPISAKGSEYIALDKGSTFGVLHSFRAGGVAGDPR